MGKITCNCLNVKIHTKSDEIKPCCVTKLGINPPAHEFFSSEIAEVILNLEGVITEHKALLRTENAGEGWMLYRCLNCKMWTHAVQGNRVLVSPRLSTTSTQIERLEQNVDFSPLYRIVLQPQNDNQPIKTRSVQSGKYESLQEALLLIQKHMEQCIRDEEAAMKTRIRLYEDQEQESYLRFQTKACRDKNAMISLILAAEENDLTERFGREPEVVRAPPSQSAAFRPTIVKSSPSPATDSGKKQMTKPLSALSTMLGSQSRQHHVQQKNIDTDDMFGMDPTFEDSSDQRSFYVSDDDDETEDTDDSEPEVRGSSSHTIYSSSVPVTVPMMGAAAKLSSSRMSGFRGRKSFEEEEEDEVPEDMAASIKALARSVHADGTEMFGDLPRSRFKTEFGKM